MVDEREQLRVRKPEALDLKNLRLDLQKALPGFLEAALRTACHLDKAEDAFLKGISNLGVNLTLTPGERAWQLLTRALAHAAIRSARRVLRSDWAGPENAWDKALAELGAELILALDRALETSEYLLTPGLLNRPKEVPGLAAAGEVLETWLRDTQRFPADQAEAAATQLPEQFVYALYDEWVARKADYKSIDEALTSRPLEALKREWAWARYRAYLWAEYQKPLFGTETFGTQLRLPDVYVPLRAYYVERLNSDRSRGEAVWIPLRRHVVWLESALDRWLADPAASKFRVLGGGPGAGKSSFLRRYAALIAGRRERPVVLIDLYLADIAGDLPALVRSYLQESGLLEHDPLHPETGERDLLVILDGLDELERAGRSGQEAARVVLREVREFTQLRARSQGDVRVLLSGREVLLSTLSDDFKQPECVLHLLPYCRSFVDLSVDPERLQEIDQREEWWDRFRNLTGRSDTLPQLPDEITGEPLLNYLVALALASGELPQGEPVNLNEVYRALVRHVWKRPWGDDLRPKPELQEFFDVLEEIAVTTWHGDGKGASVTAIRKRCEDVGLSPILCSLQTGADAGVLSLLASFFFSDRGRNAEHDLTFEFTHKSFAEYLLARRMVFSINQTCEQRERHHQARGRAAEGWSICHALAEWAQVWGPALLTENAASFLHRELGLRIERDPKLVERWRQSLSELVNALLSAGILPLEVGSSMPTCLPELNHWSRNAEAALFVALSAASVPVDTVNTRPIGIGSGMPRWLAALHAAGDQYKLVCGSGLRHLCLSASNLEGALLKDANLEGANLAGASLKGANLDGAILKSVSLVRASLEGASLKGANLKSASLLHTNLEGASLLHANLDDTYLEGANLVRANLDGAYLKGAILKGASLGGALLTGTNLANANLTGAYLGAANLSGANLGGASLEGAHLEGAYLEGAYLKGARLERALLKSANLKGAKLWGANLMDANLEGANLEGAYLKDANLEGANLEGANLYRTHHSEATRWPRGFEPRRHAMVREPG